MPDAAPGWLAHAADEAAEMQVRLNEIRGRHPASDPRMVAELVHTVLATMRGHIASQETDLLARVEELGQTIAAAKSEIAALKVDDINASHIPLATDELDAIVAHTAAATERILETCETLDKVAAVLGNDDTPASAAAARQLQGATTTIYEACSFQDITGQRITKVVATLKTIESKIVQIVAAFGPTSFPRRDAREAACPVDGAALLNGPQHATVAMGQSDIDRLLASFDG